MRTAVHKAKIALSLNSDARVLLHLQEAQENIAEIEKSARDEDKKKLDKSVDKYEENVGKARLESEKSDEKEAELSVVENELGKQRERLRELEDKVPTQAQPAIERAIGAAQNNEHTTENVKGVQNSNNNSVGNSVNENIQGSGQDNNKGK